MKIFTVAKSICKVVRITVYIILKANIIRCFSQQIKYMWYQQSSKEITITTTTLVLNRNQLHRFVCSWIMCAWFPKGNITSHFVISLNLFPQRFFWLLYKRQKLLLWNCWICKILPGDLKVVIIRFQDRLSYYNQVGNLDIKVNKKKNVKVIPNES